MAKYRSSKTNSSRVEKSGGSSPGEGFSYWRVDSRSHGVPDPVARSGEVGDGLTLGFVERLGLRVRDCKDHKHQICVT